jgi:hypothetical protein
MSRDDCEAMGAMSIGDHPMRKIREPALGGGFRRGWGKHHNSILFFEL